MQRGFQYVEQLGNRSCLAVVPSFVMFLVDGADNFGEASGALWVQISPGLRGAKVTYPPTRNTVCFVFRRVYASGGQSHVPSSVMCSPGPQTQDKQTHIMRTPPEFMQKLDGCPPGMWSIVHRYLRVIPAARTPPILRSR